LAALPLPLRFCFAEALADLAEALADLPETEDRRVAFPDFEVLFEVAEVGSNSMA
jgi:hypothetical protein